MHLVLVALCPFCAQAVWHMTELEVMLMMKLNQGGNQVHFTCEICFYNQLWETAIKLYSMSRLHF